MFSFSYKHLKLFLLTFFLISCSNSIDEEIENVSNRLNYDLGPNEIRTPCSIKSFEYKDQFQSVKVQLTLAGSKIVRMVEEFEIDENDVIEIEYNLIYQDLDLTKVEVKTYKNGREFSEVPQEEIYNIKSEKGFIQEIESRQKYIDNGLYYTSVSTTFYKYENELLKSSLTKRGMRIGPDGYVPFEAIIQARYGQAYYVHDNNKNIVQVLGVSGSLDLPIMSSLEDMHLNTLQPRQSGKSTMSRRGEEPVITYYSYEEFLNPFAGINYACRIFLSKSRFNRYLGAAGLLSNNVMTFSETMIKGLKDDMSDAYYITMDWDNTYNSQNMLIDSKRTSKSGYVDSINSVSDFTDVVNYELLCD